MDDLTLVLLVIFRNGRHCSRLVPFPFPWQGKGKMNTYWLIGHKNYSVQNDSLVCHWKPNMAKKKKKTVAGSEASVGNVSSTSSVGHWRSYIARHVCPCPAALHILHFWL